MSSNNQVSSQHELINANVFVGTSAEQIKKELTAEIGLEDMRRIFWSHDVLPKLSQEFLESVIRSPHHMKVFKFNEGDDESHIITYKCFAHLATNPMIAMRHIPWQFRIEFGPKTRQIAQTSLEFEEAMAEKTFRRANWMFWTHDTGFTIAPLSTWEELSLLSSLLRAWIKTRDAPLTLDPEMPALEQ